MTNEEISAEISKINFLMENLYAVTFRALGYRSEDVTEISDAYCRQVEDLPARTHGSAPVEDMQSAVELMSNRVAMHFAAVRDRMRQAEE